MEKYKKCINVEGETQERKFPKNSRKEKKILQRFVRSHRTRRGLKRDRHYWFLKGEIVRPNGKFRCKTLVGSGCEEIVISKEFAQEIDLKGEKTNLKAELGTEP